MAQNYAESKVLLQFPYPKIQVVWMKQMIPETTTEKERKILKMYTSTTSSARSSLATNPCKKKLQVVASSVLVNRKSELRFINIRIQISYLLSELI